MLYQGPVGASGAGATMFAASRDTAAKMTVAIMILMKIFNCCSLVTAGRVVGSVVRVGLCMVVRCRRAVKCYGDSDC